MIGYSSGVNGENQAKEKEKFRVHHSETAAFATAKSLLAMAKRFATLLLAAVKRKLDEKTVLGLP